MNDKDKRTGHVGNKYIKIIVCRDRDRDRVYARHFIISSVCN